MVQAVGAHCSVVCTLGRLICSRLFRVLLLLWRAWVRAIRTSLTLVWWLWLVLCPWQDPLRFAHFTAMVNHCIWLLLWHVLYYCRTVMVRLMHLSVHLVRERVTHIWLFLLGLIGCTHHVLVVWHLLGAAVDSTLVLDQLCKCLLIHRLVHEMTSIIGRSLVDLNRLVAILSLFVVLWGSARVGSRAWSTLSHHEACLRNIDKVGILFVLSLSLHLVQLLHIQLFGDFHLVLLLRAEVMTTVEHLSLPWCNLLIGIHLTCRTLRLLRPNIRIRVFPRKEPGLSLGSRCFVYFVFGSWTFTLRVMSNIVFKPSRLVLL